MESKKDFIILLLLCIIVVLLLQRKILFGPGFVIGPQIEVLFKISLIIIAAVFIYKMFRSWK